MIEIDSCSLSPRTVVQLSQLKRASSTEFLRVFFRLNRSKEKEVHIYMCP